MNRVGSVHLLLLSELCAHNALESMQMPTKARTEAAWFLHRDLCRSFVLLKNITFHHHHKQSELTDATTTMWTMKDGCVVGTG